MSAGPAPACSTAANGSVENVGSKRTGELCPRAAPARTLQTCSKDTIIVGFDCLSLNLNNWWLQYLLHYLCVVNIHYGACVGDRWAPASAEDPGLKGAPVSLTNDANEKISHNYFRKRYSFSVPLICAICILKVSSALLHLALSRAPRIQALQSSKFSNFKSNFHLATCEA